MNLTHKVALDFIAMYESGKFLDESPENQRGFKDDVAMIRRELDNPTVKVVDDPSSVLIPMGSVGFTTSLSDSTRLKTFGLGSCLALVSYGSSPLNLFGGEYASGSLAHIAATLDTDDLISRIINFHKKRGNLLDEINFEIHATGGVSVGLLNEVKNSIYTQTGQVSVVEDVRVVHSGNLLYDFKEGQVCEIPELNLSLPEYGSLLIPPPFSRYSLVFDKRTEISFSKLYGLLRNNSDSKLKI